MDEAGRRRAIVVELLRRHGRETTSFQILEPGFEHFVTPAGDAAVGYFDLGRTWVAAGAPIAAEDDVERVIDMFRAVAGGAGAHVVWFGVEQRPARDDLVTVPVGLQPVWDPSAWPATLAVRRSLREQLRRARAKGVTIRAVLPDEVRTPDQPTRVAVERLIARWRRTRPMPPMDFVVRVAPWFLPDERRFLVAEQGGVLVGVLIAVPIYARDGWLVEDALRDPAAPNGTMELLFDAMQRQLADDDARYVTFGLAPLAGVESRTLRVIRRLGRPLYHFDGLERFKQKLGPDAWRPVHVLHDADRTTTGAIVAVLRAFAGGSLLRFGWRTLGRHRRSVVRVAALLLLPWSAALALADTAGWFPSVAVQRGWVAFDLVLATALLWLAHDWRPRRAAWLAVAAALDAGLAVLQWVVTGRPVLDTPWRIAWAGAGLVAPIGAAIFLWTHRRDAADVK